MMNGYSYQPPGLSDERQPPSIPSITQLQINRPLSNSGSPNPSQLPPLNSHFQPPSTTYLPPLADRPGPSAAQNHQQHNPAFPQDKTASLSQIAPHQQFGSTQPAPYHSYPPNYSSGPQQSFPPPITYTNGDQAHSGQQSFPGPLTQPPAFVEPNHSQHNLLPPFNPQPPQQPLQASNGAASRDHRPVPVVGSQGRRGILPSAPGRPPITQNLDAAMRGQLANNAVKGPDGKYACQFCSKVYLHLKHLKRHHLRHTGERPYQCSLCQETFCRSDILKRHFQKCSIRRGNPMNVTHLTHAQAHLRRGSQPPSSGGAPAASPANGVAAPGQPAPPSSYRANWPNGGAAQAQPGQDPGSARTSRSSSIVHRPSSSAEDRKSFHSTTGTAPQTGNTSLNTSPSSSAGEDRKYNSGQFPMSRDLPSTHQFHDHPNQQPPPAQYPGYYGSAPQHFVSSSQPETFPTFGYGQTNGHYYAPPSEPPRFNEHHWGPYQQYFQPGSQDPLMSYPQQ